MVSGRGFWGGQGGSFTGRFKEVVLGGFWRVFSGRFLVETLSGGFKRFQGIVSGEDISESLQAEVLGYGFMRRF